MAVNPEPQVAGTPRKHGLTPMPRLARDVVERNESVLFGIHEDAISGMEALHDLELPADATPAQREAKRRAFYAMSSVARLSDTLETMNTNLLTAKDDGKSTRDAIAKVDDAQRKRKAAR